MKVPQKPTPFRDLLKKYAERLPEIVQGVTADSKDRYLHWDKLRHLTPPAGLNHEEWWLGVKFSRMPLYRELPLKDAGGRPFRYALPDIVLQKLHLIDRKAGGRIELPEQVTNPETRDRYIVNSLVEEAITSSQLEGASTTRQVAADMLRSGVKPRNTSEQIIFNNFRAMEDIRALKTKPLSPETVLELHKVLTKDTLDDPTAAGRLQSEAEERVEVRDNANRRTLHAPPPANQLRARLAQMCEFGNSTDQDKHFVHPLIRAIILHFWLAYDHPFIDGNSRTARTLFYWSMLEQGYWLFEYISISRILRKAPAQYGESYLYSETDDNDMTYFIIYQLEVIARAIHDLEEYLKIKSRQVQDVERILNDAPGLNHRQIALLSHALRHTNAEYSIHSHQGSHNIAYATARADLFALADAGLLIRRKLGKTFTFFSPPSLEQRLTTFARTARRSAKR